MENAESILVVILSVFLAVFLLLSIILLIKCIQLVNHLKRIADKAESVVDKADSVGEFIKNASTSFTVGRVISQVVSSFVNRTDKKPRRKETNS